MLEILPSCTSLVDLALLYVRLYSVPFLLIISLLFLFPQRGCTALLELPEYLGLFASLRTLDLILCQSLTRLPDSLGQLAGLLHLDLRGCDVLTSFPDSMDQLRSLVAIGLPSCVHELPGWVLQQPALQYLSAAGSIRTCLPESLGQLTALQRLILSSNSQLSRLPESLGQLAALISLDLSSCETLRTLPASVGQLGALRELSLRFCSNLTMLPESLELLGCLQVLDLEGCNQLALLPERWGRQPPLETLNLRLCHSLTFLPESLGQLGHLRDLNLEWCPGLTALPFAFAFLPDTFVLRLANTSLQLPPTAILKQGLPAIRATLLRHHYPLKILLLILGARRRRTRHLPAELWALLRDHLAAQLPFLQQQQQEQQQFQRQWVKERRS